MPRPITTIGFDADDTLWHNENLFEEHHRKYCELLSEYHDSDVIEQRLYETEMRNLELFGYGIKGFTLSCIETAISLTQGQIRSEEIRRIIDYCKQMLEHPVELLDGALETVEALAKEYRLFLITKGDLRDQERKIAASGIAHCFEHVVILSDKNVESYSRALRKENIAIEQFAMVGNSLKSDILPVLELGGQAFYIPYRITWKHEAVESESTNANRFFELDSIGKLPDILKKLDSHDL